MSVVDFAAFLRYEPDTGRLVWLVDRPPRMKAGDEAGCVRNDGRYRTLVLHQKRYYAHRVIWQLVHGPIADGLCIDHIDGNGLNNRIENLRVVSLATNQRNRVVSRNNTTGVSGVFDHKGGFSVYCAGLYVTYSKDFFEACCARKSAELRAGYLNRKAIQP